MKHNTLYLMLRSNAALAMLLNLKVPTPGPMIFNSTTLAMNNIKTKHLKNTQVG